MYKTQDQTIRNKNQIYNYPVHSTIVIFDSNAKIFSQTAFSN